MSDNANATAIRGKDWVFNAIWSSCGVDRAPRCIMNMPITFLFRHGEPFKALMTDEVRGEVVRVNMDNVELEEKDNAHLRGSSQRRLRVMRKLVLDYMEYHNYMSAQTSQTKRISKVHNSGDKNAIIDDDGEPYVISVIYQDGEREDLSLRTLDILLRNDTWRPQILIMQAYIPSLSIQSGRFSLDGEKKVRSLLEKEGAEAADKVTRALAKYSEQAYKATQGSVLGVQPGISKFTGAPLEVKLTVTEMHASFALDHRDKCVFLYSDFTMVDLDSGRREAEKFLTKEKSGRELAAARSVYRELKILLVHATKRGLSLQESFTHFDMENTGFVDTDMLIDGLARLGIGVTYPVAEQVLALIGGIGNNFLDIKDFERYLKDKVADDFAELDGSTSEFGASRVLLGGSAASSTSPSGKQNRLMKGNSSNASSLYPPPKPGSLSPLDDVTPGSSLTAFSNLEESQNYEWDESALYGTTGTRPGAKSTSAKKAVAQAQKDARTAAKTTAQSFDGSDLPAPQEDYKIKPHVREAATTLHPLASKRNQRALKELRVGHEKWVKKKESATGSNLNSADGVAPAEDANPPRALSRGSSRGDKKHPQSISLSDATKKSADSLTLTTIVREMNSKLNRSPDELCHIDNGVVMTYRILQGQGLKDIRLKEETEAFRNRSIFEDKEKKMTELGLLEAVTTGTAKEKGYESETDSQGNPIVKDNEKDPRDVDRWVAFTLVIIPDLFMTLDTLQLNFEPLLTKYPHSRIILVGLPGAPNTVWPNGWVLNSDLHARSIAKLLQFLKQKKKLSPMVGEPIYMMGFGIGVQSLSRFVTLYSPGLPWLESVFRAVILVNGLLKFNKAFKNVCKDLRTSLLQAGGHEVNELITSLHFHDDYIYQEGDVEIRAKILRRFWETRRGLMSEQPEGGQYPVSKAGLGYIGVLEQLKGILTSPDNFDGAQMLVGSNVPVLVVQSTEDVFVNPRNAAVFQADKLPPERKLVTNIVDALDENAVHVSWLKAGHEVIQERTSFLLGMVSNLAQMCGIHPVLPEKKEGSTENEVEEDIFDVLALAEQRKQAKLKEIADAKAAAEEEERLIEEAKKEAKRLKKEEKAKKKEAEAAFAAKLSEDEAARKLEEQLLVEAELAEAAEEAKRQEQAEKAEKMAEEEEERKIRNAAEKERRGKLAAERKKRELKAARRAEMEQFYERERIEKEKKGEKKEMEKMEKEDRRSRFAAEYQKSVENTARSKRIAAAKAEALRVKRKEEAIKRVEEKLNRERAARAEERRRKAEESVKNILSEFLVLSGEAQSGGYEIRVEATDPNGIFSTITSCHRIMQDLLQCREKQVEAMKRQKLIESKYLIFKNQVQSVDHEIRMLRRAIRLIELNPAIVGAKPGEDPDELHELKRNLASKEETFLELTAVSKSRQEQLSAANAAVQKLKLVTRERDELMQLRIKEMQNMEENLSNKSKTHRNEKERVNESREKLKLQEVIHKRRYDTLSKEREKIRTHKGKTIDTDAWIEGVMQRSQTKELKAHLKEEAKKELEKLEVVREGLRELMEKVFKLEDAIARDKRDSDKIGIACKAFMREYKKFSTAPLSELMTGLVTNQNVAEKNDNRKEREAKLRALQDDSNAEKSAMGLDFNAVEDVRTKDFELRSPDERRFVGIDLVMNPDKYLHVSMVEAEQMRFDEDYQCELLKPDLDRIYGLPEQIQLAMPFLHTVKEVEAHRLLNFYWRNKDDSFFRQKDYMYQEAGEEEVKTDDLDTSEVIALKPTDMHEAEIVHDILVKMARRDNIRGKGAGDSYTQSEADWQYMDKVLNPEVYNIHPREDDISKRPVVTDLTFNAVYMQSASSDGSKITPINPESASHMRTRHNPLSKKDPAFDGNLFQESRFRYEDGEKVFDDTWRCPFNRDELLAIRSRPDMNDCTEDELHARRLLDTYYVSENESIMGSARLKLMYGVTKRISNFFIDSDKEAALDAKQKRVERGVLRGGTDRIDESRSKQDEEQAARDKDEMDEIRKRMASEDGSDINRIWGPWDQVHPASGGVDSQSSYFLKSAFDPSRDHPANFGLHDEAHWLRVNAARGNEGSGKHKLPDNPHELQELSLAAVKAIPGEAPTHFDTHENDPTSDYLICDNLKELANMEVRRVKGKIVLLANPVPLIVFETKEATLQSRQSRSHRFEIPNRDDQRVLDITVSIVFQGNFANKGYKLGRLAAGLFRLPDERDTHANPMPVPVGFAPYSMQSPNLPETLGRIVILHRPKRRPLKHGFFQIVIGVASNTKYSIDVSCRIARAALPVVDERVTHAKQMQARLPLVLHELDDLQESLRLAERKLLVCQKMIDEAQVEMDKAQSGMGIVSRKLEIDDEEMTLLEDERKELERELAILEVEYTQWSGLYSSRNQEHDDIKEGIKLIFEFQRTRQNEKKKLKAELDQARHDCPACIAALRGIVEATNVAVTLNTTVQGASAAWGASFSGKTNAGGGPNLVTPAEDCRRRVKREGFNQMVAEEQQWCLLDQALNPHKYEWLKEQEEEEAQHRLAMGKMPKVKKYPPAIEAFKLPKSEIQSIMNRPFAMLSRKEVVVRKLLVKYHDDPSVLKRSFAAAAFGFDPHRAERTRSKMPATYTQEEREWSSIDRILHPEVWTFYVNHDKVTGMDKNKKESDRSGEKGSGMNKGADEVKQEVNTAKKDAVSAMGKILGMTDNFNNEMKGEGFSVGDMIAGAQKSLTTQENMKKAQKFVCGFSKEKIMQIWRTPKHKLKTDDERLTFKLLQKFNGTCEDYMEAVEASAKRDANGIHEGSHIKWEVAGRTPTHDVDMRARLVLHEIDRAANTTNAYMSSDVLHTSDQMFPTPVLRIQLEEELDRILADQILDREKAMRIRLDSDSGSDDSDDDDVELHMQVDPSLEGEEKIIAERDIMEKVKRRAKRRDKRKKVLKEPTMEQEIINVKKLTDVKGKSGKELEEMQLINQLGFGGCLACRSNPCAWRACVDTETVNERIKILDKEAERVRLDKDSRTIESDIALSAQLGGNRIFKRLDLLHELDGELAELRRHLHLNDVDRELHEAYSSRKEFVEVKSLHGYSMMLWTNNARVALEARQSRMVAYTVSKDVVNDILDWMLEGWYFGERESSFSVLGLVPSVAENGKYVRAGQGQINAAGAVIKKIRHRKDARKKGKLLDEQIQGTMVEKSLPIEDEKNSRLKVLKVARDGNRHEHMLNETEQTLRFGLFMLALMYFRAMTFVQREKKSWSGEGDAVGAGKKPKMMTDERMQMVDEENKAAARKKKVDLVLARCKVGDARRREREEAERREAILELQKVVRRQKLEFGSVTTIQRVYRGHLGRKAAKRWALKRAELGAMNALLHATATCLQRVYRGYLARVLTIRTRAEMAQFIALMRAQEAQADEEVFWETHPWQRFKRDQKEWADRKLRAAHKTEVLGGARLSEEEEAALKEEAMNQIDDQLEDESDDENAPPPASSNEGQEFNLDDVGEDD